MNNTNGVEEIERRLQALQREARGAVGRRPTAPVLSNRAGSERDAGAESQGRRCGGAIRCSLFKNLSVSHPRRLLLRTNNVSDTDE